ncbi:MAG: prolyl oligopeptidase family serine peptidase [Tepidisphaeraceae bacterium]|jgi:prolyl oligopeptidase
MKSLIQSGFIVAALTIAVLAADAPPVAPVREVIDDYHGTKIADPYRYLENLADPEVRAWIKGQAEYAQRVLGAIPGRSRLLERIRELDAGAPYRISVLRRWPNGDLHYLKTLAAGNLDKLYFKDAGTGEERLLVDPEKMAEGGRHYALDFCTPSPDGRYVAYGVAAAGSEQTVLHVLDTTTGKDLPDLIDRMEADYTHPCWLPDASGFVYSRRRQLPADAPATEGYKQTRACFHNLGADPAKDPVVFAMNTSPAAALSEVDFPSIVLTTGSRFAIGKIKHGDANELTLYAAPLSALREQQIPWKKICDAKDEVEEFAVHGDDVYLMTAAGAPRYRVVTAPLDAPDFTKVQNAVPAGEAVITGIAAAKDALYVALLDNGVSKVGRVAFEAGAKLEMIALPAEASDGHPTTVHPDVDGALVTTSSWTRGGRIYAYDPKTRALADTNLRPRGKYDDVEGYESAEVLVPSHDGVKVPLSILYRKGIKLDGSHPTLVSGYGGYGMRSSAAFNPVRLAWLERGGVLAIAHVRGGGEYGKEWHMAGRQQTKPNTWKDFIACCEYLVQKGYTSTPRLAGLGGSAGGILIGRAITERPDLYAAAIIEVGCLDMLRFETTTNGVPNIPELGSTRTKEGFESLLRMSSYHQVKDGTKYPAVLLTHGINDPRVEPWMSAKMTARLQRATTSGKPVLFRVDYDAGHGIGSTRTQRQEQTADMWAFLFWQMAEEGFGR